MSRLHRYARTGNYTAAADCLAQGEAVNAVSVHHFSPLMLAAQNGHTDVVRLLLKAGADVHAAHPNGRTALHMAASGGHLEAVSALVAHGAEMNVVSRIGATPALEAAKFNRADVVAFLKAHGADLNRRDRDGLTAEEWLAKGGVFGQSKQQYAVHLEKPQVRKHAEDNVRKLMAEGMSADEYAAKHGRFIYVWSYGAYRFEDAEVGAWASRVAEILFTPGLLDECEERHLSGDEREHARKCRQQREKRRLRRSVRNRSGTDETSFESSMSSNTQ